MVWQREWSWVLSTPADIRHDILRMMFGITGKDRKMFQRWRKKKRRKKRKRKRILSVISQGLEARLENLGENPSRKQLKKLFDPRQ